eukprot:6125419-Pleurochrysis_carterae.AAC.1
MIRGVVADISSEDSRTKVNTWGSVAWEGTLISITVYGQMRRSAAGMLPKSLAPGLRHEQRKLRTITSVKCGKSRKWNKKAANEAHLGMLQRLHFSRKAKLMLPQFGHFQSPGALPGPLPLSGIAGFSK